MRNTMKNQTENQKKIWESLEMVTLRAKATILFLCDVVFSVIYTAGREGELAWMLFGLLQVVFIPFLGFFLWRMWNICRKAEAYTFHRCTLSTPHFKPFIRSYYFDVLIRTEEEAFVTETHAIFAPYGVVPPLMHEYINKTVTVGYNPETDMIVVIG